MAMTYTETAETRFIFNLQSDNGTGTAFTTRTIAVPGQPPERAQTDFLAALRTWRTELLGNSLNTFIQPSNWRDNTGSSESEPPVAPYKTVGLEVELYTVQRTKWDDESLQPT